MSPVIDFCIKKVFIFDWDGTILDSAAQKLNGLPCVLTRFYVQNYNVTVSTDDIKATYASLCGYPRRDIFFDISRRLGLPVTDAQYERFNSDLCRYYQVELLQAPLFTDALRLIDVLHSRGRVLFISSSVPHTELLLITRTKLDPAHYSMFSAIFGSAENFTKGVQHLSRVGEMSRCTNDEILFIGDDRADYELSSAAGVDCVIVDRQQRHAGEELPVVASLDLLIDRISTCVLH